MMHREFGYTAPPGYPSPFLLTMTWATFAGNTSRERETPPEIETRLVCLVPSFAPTIPWFRTSCTR